MSRRNGIHKLTATSPGQTMAEYALILATIAVVATAFVQSAGVIVTGLIHRVITLL